MTITSSYQFVTKDGSLTPFKTVGTSEFFSDFAYGDVITGSLNPLKSKLYSDYYFEGMSRPKVHALRNTLNYYKYLSPYYSYEYYETAPLRTVQIPSIFYGKSIKKGSVSCRWYLTGTLIGELRDLKKNGELIQVYPSDIGDLDGSGSVAGVVLYNEGFLLLTGSWPIHLSYVDDFNIFDLTSFSYRPQWQYWFTTGSVQDQEGQVPSSSFGFDFEGTEEIPTITMMTRASKGEFNHSNNPTFIKYGQTVTPFTSSNAYIERNEIELKNIVKVPYDEVEPKFEKTTFISKIGIYDENKNLIAIAKLATPVRKKESESLNIKLKLDM